MLSKSKQFCLLLVYNFNDKDTEKKKGGQNLIYPPKQNLK